MSATRACALAAFTAIVAASAPLATPAAPPSTLESDVPGPDKSPVPSYAEWQAATQVKLSRTSPAASGCVASRVREWLRVRCPQRTFAISLLGGSNEGLSFWIGPEDKGRPGEVQFPLRRGDRRVLQLWTDGKAADGSAMPEPSLVVQEQWLEGQAAPTVSVL
jgi:hypothetical protein